MDIRSLQAVHGYGQLRPASSEKPNAGSGEQAGGLAAVAQGFEKQLSTTDQVAQAAMIGQADSQALVEALAQTELAIETAATVRDKVVEAYQEILRMPI